MNTVYRFKIKLSPILILTALISGFGVLFYTMRLFKEALIVGLIYLFLIALVLLYYLGKRLVVDEDGITLCVLWKVGVSGARWEHMEEAMNVSGRMTQDPANAIQHLEGALTPGGALNTLVGRMKVHLIKIIVKNAEPLIIDVRAIVKPAGLEDLIAKKVRFVK